MTREPIAYINVEKRTLEFAKNIFWHTPTVANLDRIPLFTKEALAQPEQEPVAWFRYQQGSRVYYDSKKWDDCQPLYTQSASDYERGFIDGMQKQMQSSVDKAVNAMSQRPWVGLTDEDISEIVRGTHNTGSFVRAINAKLKEKNT